MAVERRDVEVVVLGIGAAVAQFHVGRFCLIGEVDALVAAVIGVDYFPDVRAVDVVPGQAAVGGRASR